MTAHMLKVPLADELKQKTFPAFLYMIPTPCLFCWTQQRRPVDQVSRPTISKKNVIFFPCWCTIKNFANSKIKRPIIPIKINVCSNSVCLITVNYWMTQTDIFQGKCSWTENHLAFDNIMKNYIQSITFLVDTTSYPTGLVDTCLIPHQH